MTDPGDLVFLPYTPDLTAAGIEWIIQNAFRIKYPGKSVTASNIHSEIFKIAANISFRRYLTKQGIRFQVKPYTSFIEPEHYELYIANHRCHIFAFLITNPKYIQHFQRQPGLWSELNLLIPSDSLVSDIFYPGEIYIFIGLLINLKQDGKGPFYYLFPPDWRYPAIWAPLGKIIFTSEQPSSFQIVGMDSTRNRHYETIDLPHNTPYTCLTDFYALGCMLGSTRPVGEIGVASARLNKVQVLRPANWFHLESESVQMVILGFLSAGELRNVALPVTQKPVSTPYILPPAEKYQELSTNRLHPIGALINRSHK